VTDSQRALAKLVWKYTIGDTSDKSQRAVQGPHQLAVKSTTTGRSLLFKRAYFCIGKGEIG
jgi:hypothetical protein